MGVNDLKRVVGRISKSVSWKRAGMKRLPPTRLETAFGVIHLQKGENLFHSPTYFHDGPVHSRPQNIPIYGPTETMSPWFYTEDTPNSWMYQLEQDLVLLKLYRDSPPMEDSEFSRTSVKDEAYETIFEREPQIPLFQWRGKTSMERDSLVEAIFALGHDGFISTGDNTHDGRLEVCIHKTELLSHVPRPSDAEVTTFISIPQTEIFKEAMKDDMKDKPKNRLPKIFMKIIPGTIFCVYEDFLLSSDDGTWKLPDREMQEAFIAEFLSETNMPPFFPPFFLPPHEELVRETHIFFQMLSMLDTTTQQKIIKEAILQAKSL